MTDIDNTQTQPDAPENAQALLDAMPGMVGAIDHAFRTELGRPTLFVLVAFTEGAAVHATNITPAANAIEALQSLVSGWAGIADTAEDVGATTH